MPTNKAASGGALGVHQLTRRMRDRATQALGAFDPVGDSLLNIIKRPVFRIPIGHAAGKIGDGSDVAAWLKSHPRSPLLDSNFREKKSMVDLKTGYTRLIIDTCLKHGLLRNQAAYVLATARWETAHTMKPVKEAYWLSETWRKNNLRYYPWYGRGFVQITWEANYQKAAKKTGVPLDKDPDLALDPHTAADVLVIGMAEGWFTGKKLSDYITLRASNFVGARRIVNGTDKATQIANLAKQYDALLKAEGYGEDTPARDIGAPVTSKPSLLSLILSFFSNLFRRSK